MGDYKAKCVLLGLALMLPFGIRLGEGEAEEACPRAEFNVAFSVNGEGTAGYEPCDAM